MSEVTEKAVLLNYLAAQRRHILSTIDGLTDDQFGLAPLPSGWSITAMINHAALDDEMFWFVCVLGADEEAIASLDGDGWLLSDEDTPPVVLARYREQVARADDVLATVDLDVPPAWWPTQLFGEWRLQSTREVVLHAITELSCHAGHLDAARELIDGRQHLVLDPITVLGHATRPLRADLTPA